VIDTPEGTGVAAIIALFLYIVRELLGVSKDRRARRDAELRANIDAVVKRERARNEAWEKSDVANIILNTRPPDGRGLRD